MTELFDLWQRLVEDEKCGLNYDYMGYAEYEFGATLNSRTRLADWLKAGVLTSWRTDVSLIERQLTFKKTVLLFSHVDTIRKLNALNLSVCSIKGALEVESRNIIGWLSVGTDTPIIIMPISPSLSFADAEREHCTRLVHKYLELLITKGE